MNTAAVFNIAHGEHIPGSYDEDFTAPRADSVIALGDVTQVYKP